MVFALLCINNNWIFGDREDHLDSFNQSKNMHKTTRSWSSHLKKMDILQGAKHRAVNKADIPKKPPSDPFQTIVNSVTFVAAANQLLSKKK